ncbi:sialic acid-binding Ig-like lectin 15 [Salminus brasiliensis]|uniref:sialic acid-binding Ig-like lectin 15 n=1 Tax=Salminus brasiliensis TaxID=930266 RepID=UPI003B836A79
MELIQIVCFFSFSSSGLTAAKQWSMTVPKVVNQTLGEDAIMPCSFTTTYDSYQGDITVIWRIQCHYNGPLIFRCLSKDNPSESGQNCSKSVGRYSLFGNPRSNNISLRIQNVSLMDRETYFCRVELTNNADQYGTHTGTTLNIQVPQALESIYMRTLPSGEQFVTCEVKGTPPPTVTWINPEITSASLVSVQSDWARASSSIPANLTNTNYTCQIHGENGLQLLSIYYSRVTKQDCPVSLSLFVVFVILSGIFFIALVILAVICKKGSSKSLPPTQNLSFRNSEPQGKDEDRDEDIYENI